MHVLHIYCRVVDNFGDAGICWRLARQLAGEHALAVTLWIDQPAVLQPLAPDLTLATPRRAGAAGSLTVRQWPIEAQHTRPDVLICAFGCEPPPWLRARLGPGMLAPLWINLEYLSAETWVQSCHGLASIKPADGAIEYFFYPGFRDGTGGLLRERDLLARRDAFLASPQATQWWRDQALPAAPGCRLSVFCYPEAPVSDLLAGLMKAVQPAVVLIPEGVASDAPERFITENAGQRLPTRLAQWRIGSLVVARLPMLPIDDYDRLLWCCDLNFVRGEDSWVRALWAGKPLLWQPYRQPDDTDQLKQTAFLQWQREALNPAAATAGSLPAPGPLPALPCLERLSRHWRSGSLATDDWPAVQQALPALTPAFDALARRLSARDDLASELVKFCRSKI